MEAKNAELQPVVDRLARVERQNCWLMSGGLALLLSCTSVLLMAQKPAAQTIEAQAFVLKDAAGKVRAELRMTGSGLTGPEFGLYGSQHKTSAHLHVDDGLGPGLDLYTKEGDSAGLSIPEIMGPLLSLHKGEVAAVLHVDEDLAFLSLRGLGDSANVTVGKDGPNLSLRDSASFNASIGSEGLVTPTTGEKSQTSAASIHLFDPKGKILWSAP